MPPEQNISFAPIIGLIVISIIIPIITKYERDEIVEETIIEKGDEK